MALDCFKFALVCASPSATDETKVKCLMNKMRGLSRSVLPAVLWTSISQHDSETREIICQAPINFHRKVRMPESDAGGGKKKQFYWLMLLTLLTHSDDALRQRILVKLAADGTNVRYDGVVEDLINYESTISKARALEVPTF
ncbi:hypothetical protein GPALN_006108 [Globodera pallida]|nr:hypothetical protein GPALN_006108 [Globodera pallida]